SNFEILVPDGVASHIGRSPGIVCGLGWHFSSSADPESGYLNHEGNILPAWRILVYCDPYLMRQASYGTLSFSFDIQHLLVPQNTNHYSSLNPTYRDSQIGTFVYVLAGGPTMIPTIAITVKLPTDTVLSLPASLTPKMEQLLAGTMDGKEAVDVKFCVFTGKRAGYATDPRAIFAKSTIMERHSEELDLLISGGAFSESLLVDLDCPIDQDFLSLDEYGYPDDSDLDSDDEEMEEGCDTRTRSRACSPNFREVVQTPLPESGDSDSDKTRSDVGPSPISIKIPVPAPHIPTGPRRMGRVVPLKGTAFKTWRALIYYLYTGKLSFSSVPRLLGSEDTPQCSAKSMYRLADKASPRSLHELKAVSLSSINANLSSQIIVQQVFSKFTSVYPEIQDIEVRFLLDNFEAVWGEIDGILEQISKGERPYCADVVRKIVWGRNIPAPVAHNAPTKQTPPG
ncbi:hypothetical protein C8R47DRAFT_1165561, partial [Mycena vitilis]